MARARWSALLTDATLVSSSSATSVACQRSTSHRISTDRWREGRCCSAATNARRIDSRAAATSAGSPSVAITRESRMGCTNRCSGLCGPSTTSAVAVEGPSSMGRARRCGLRTMSMHTLLAMRYSQVRSEERPSKPSMARHAEHHGLLHRVLGLGPRAEHAVAEPGELPAVRLEGCLELGPTCGEVSTVGLRGR